MAWREVTVDLDNVVLTLDAISAGTYPPWLLDPGSIDPDSLFLDVFGVLDGRAVRTKVYMLFDFTGGVADPGWSSATAAYGSVASAMAGADPATLTRETYCVRRGNSFERRMLLVWK